MWPVFHRAADRRGLGDRRLLSGERGFERLAEPVLAGRTLVAVVVDRPVVDELPLAIEEEDLGRSRRPEGTRERLVLVPEVVEVEAALRGALLHLLERVGRVFLDVVRADGDEPDAAVRVVALDLD